MKQLANIKNTIIFFVRPSRRVVAKTRDRGVFFSKVFVFQFLSLFSCNVISACSVFFLHLWWKLVKNIKELTEGMKVLKEYLSFFLKIGLFFFASIGVCYSK